MPNSPLRVNVTTAGLRLDEAALREALAKTPANAPVVVMIHGFRFAPGARGNCPHLHIFSMSPPGGDRTAVSWPGQWAKDGQAGLTIALGWPARGNLIAASARAKAAGRALAELARLVRQIDPVRQLDVIAHSLGARVALSALHHAEPGAFRRMILLAGAETLRPATAAMATPAGQAVQVINVTTRENDLFDFLYEWLANAGLDASIGQGLRRHHANWLDLQIDQAATRVILARLGHALPAPLVRICHWSLYTRSGTFSLYRALLTGVLSVPELRALLPERPDRRWSRLWSSFHLPFGSGTA